MTDWLSTDLPAWATRTRFNARLVEREGVVLTAKNKSGDVGYAIFDKSRSHLRRDRRYWGHAMCSAPKEDLMALHYDRDGYTFRADAHGLNIQPGPNAITLKRMELDQLGLDVRDDHKIPLPDVPTEREPTIDGIVSALSEALKRCRGPEEAWMAMNLRRAMVLVGGLDEKVAQEILDQEGT